MSNEHSQKTHSPFDQLARVAAPISTDFRTILRKAKMKNEDSRKTHEEAIDKTAKRKERAEMSEPHGSVSHSAKKCNTIDSRDEAAWVERKKPKIGMEDSPSILVILDDEFEEKQQNERANDSLDGTN
jgi:hypothetical protein